MRDRALIARIAGSIFAMHEPVLQSFLLIVERHASGDKVDDAEVARIVAMRGDDPDADEARSSRGYVTRGTVAVVPVGGVIAKHASSVNGASQPRGTATETIRNAVHRAVADDQVGSILLQIESPGGTVDGVKALADDLFAMRAEAAAGGKPVWTVFDDLGASAAYWLGVQASRVFASTPITEVGSIGVYVAVPDFSRKLDRDGITMNVIRTGRDKGAGVFGSQITPEQIQLFQERINGTFSQFLADIARARGRSVDALTPYATGKVFKAAEALAGGLIDGVARPEQLVAEMTQLFPSPAARRALRGTVTRAGALGESTASTQLPLPSAAASVSMPAAAPVTEVPMPPEVLAATAGAAPSSGAAAPIVPTGTPPSASAPAPAPASPASPAAPAGTISAETAEQLRREGEARLTARLQLLEETARPFLHLAGVSEELAKARSDQAITVEQFRQSVLAKAAAACRPLGTVTAGADEWVDKRRPAMELALLVRANPHFTGILEAGDAKADRLATRMGFRSTSGKASSAALAAIRELEASGIAMVSMRRIAEHCLARAGHRVPESDVELYGAVTGTSGSEYVLIMANVLNKELMSTFEIQEVTWRKWARKGTSRDYREKMIVTKSGRGKYQLVPEGDSPTRSQPSERKASIQVAKYGDKFALTYEMMVNDDLGAFTDQAVEMGRMAAYVPEELAFTILQANPVLADGVALFHVTRGNIANPAAAMDYANVWAGRTAMRRQKDFGPGKQPLDIKPRVLLCEVSNEGTANGLAKDQFIPGNQGDQRQNQLRGTFEPVASPRVTNAAAWWLVGDDPTRPLMQVDFLDGREEPTIKVMPQLTQGVTEYEAMLWGVGVAAVNPEAGYYSGH